MSFGWPADEDKAGDSPTHESLDIVDVEWPDLDDDSRAAPVALELAGGRRAEWERELGRGAYGWVGLVRGVAVKVVAARSRAARSELRGYALYARHLPVVARSLFVPCVHRRTPSGECFAMPVADTALRPGAAHGVVCNTLISVVRYVMG